jgi:hypothetical protein
VASGSKRPRRVAVRAPVVEATSTEDEIESEEDTGDTGEPGAKRKKTEAVPGPSGKGKEREGAGTDPRRSAAFERALEMVTIGAKQSAAACEQMKVGVELLRTLFYGER